MTEQTTQSPYILDGYVLTLGNSKKTPLIPTQYATRATANKVLGILETDLSECGPYQIVSENPSNRWNVWLQGDGADPALDLPLEQFSIRRVTGSVIHNAGLLYKYLNGPYRQTAFEEFRAEVAP